MMSASASSAGSAATGADPEPIAAVRLEVRQGTGAPVLLDVHESGFLIGTVPGCDLRVPGLGLPPVLALLTCHSDGPHVRKLSPTQVLLINGRPTSGGRLSDGDGLTLGGVELRVLVTGSSGRMLAPRLEPFPQSSALPQELDAQAKALEEERARWHRLRAEMDEERRRAEERRREELDAQVKELARAAHQLEEQRRTDEAQRATVEQQLAERQAANQAQEERLASARDSLERGQAQYHADLVRLHRLEAALEDRQRSLEERERQVTLEAEQTRELREALANQEAQVREDTERLTRQQAELDAALADVAKRSLAFEGQQAVLTALRTRLERLREELRHEGLQLAEQRSKLTAAEADLAERLQEVQRLRGELDAQKQSREEERQQFAERTTVMEEALAQFRKVQADLEEEEGRLRDRARLLNAAADEQAEEASVLRAKAAQLVALQQRLAADRQTFRERETALVQAEQVRERLQEQLRRRSEDLAVRQRELVELSRVQAEQVVALDAQRLEIEQARRDAEAHLAQQRDELDQRAAELDRLRADVAAQIEVSECRLQRLRKVGRTLGAARKLLRTERRRWDVDRVAATEADARRHAELEVGRQEVLILAEQLPELELRAQGALEQLAAARAQLREHLAELHDFLRQGREDLEALRTQVATEAELTRQQELALHRAREEHRLAVASFRQQLIEWQGQVADMKRALAQDETRLERRQAQVTEQTRQIDVASAQLLQRTEQVAEQERLVSERRGTMERHLDDMREWYRRKLRELAGVAPAPPPGTESPSPVVPRDILPLTGDPEPGDEQLGNLLRKLELVDAETLATLHGEARRQRRSLRQLLLAGGYLTLYQMALIEAGDLDALVLGPVRVIDRLRATTHETVYRVFDPRRGAEAVLRHLSEADLEDAVRPDEFRQRFAQAATISQPNVAATLEVLELAGRPAVLQEWLTGLPATDWPPLTGVPGVWYRLLHQAARGLHAAHEAGVVHGHLCAGQLLLTAEGVLKLCGFGEPPWLHAHLAHQEDVAADLAALGRLAADWAVKPLVEPLAAVLHRLTTDTVELRYAHAGALLEELERLEPDVPNATPAWRRFLHAVRNSGEDDVRQTA